MAFRFSQKSLDKMKGVHPDLVKVVKRALELSSVDFTVVEGLRTLETQKKYVATGKSTTMNSRHLTGHAIDIAPYVKGTISWDWKDFYPMAEAMKKAAAELKVPIEWGGDWKTFKDGPHFQLPFASYPK